MIKSNVLIVLLLISFSSFALSILETNTDEQQEKVTTVEQIKTDADVDAFLSNMIPYGQGLDGTDHRLKTGDEYYLLHSAKWFKVDFNQDGKLDLLVYGISRRKTHGTHRLFLVASTTKESYQGMDIFNDSYKTTPV